MSNKTNFNPEGNLLINGGITADGYLDVTSDSTLGGNLSVSGETNIVGNTSIQGDLTVGGKLNVESTELTTFAGDVAITGNLTANGEITFSNTTINVVETVNNFDGYVLNADNSSLAYFQINSDVSNIQLEYTGNTLTVGYSATTEAINLNAQAVNISDNVTIGGYATVSDYVTIGGTLAVTNNTTLANTSIAGDLTTTGNVEITGTETVSGELTVNNDTNITGNINFSNSSVIHFDGTNSLSLSNYTGTAATADVWNTPRNLTITLTGDVNGTATFVGLDGSESLSVDLDTTVTENNVELGVDTFGNYVATIADSGNTNIVVNNSGTENANVTLDLSNTGVVAGSYGTADQVAQITVDEKGRVSVASNVSISIISGQVTDFVTAVRSNVSNSTGLDYNVSTGTFSVSDTTIASGTYNSNLSTVTEFTVNQQGQLTNATTSAIEITSDQVSDFNTAVSSYITDGVYVTEVTGVIDITSNVITNDRNATLDADYTFTGNVNLSGASFETPANVAKLDTNQTFTADNIFTSNVDLSNATVIDPRLVRTDTDAILASDYAFTGNVNLTGAVVTATTQSNTDQTSKVATTQYVENRITGLYSNIIGDAPGVLNTLGEIANALIDDANIGNVLTSSIVNLSGNTLFTSGNVAMSGDLDLGSNKIVSLAEPTLSSDAATKSYVDTANTNMQTYVDTANTNMQTYVDTSNTDLKTYTDTNKVDNTFQLSTDSAVYLKVKLANGDIVDSNDPAVPNPASDPNTIKFNTSGDLKNITIGTVQYNSPFAILHQGEQGGVGDGQRRHGNIIFTGTTDFMPGLRANANASPSESGSGLVRLFGPVQHIKDAANSSAQFFLSNVSSVFYKNTIGPVTGASSQSAISIDGSNIFVITGNLDSESTYIGANTTGTLSNVAAYSNVEVGIPRAHELFLGKSTTYIGDRDNSYIYTSVYDLDTETSYTTGVRPLERLTVDGAIVLGNRHTPANLLVNGTIFYDANTNILKAVQGDAIYDLVNTTIQSLDLGSAGGTALASLTNNTYFLKQVSSGDGVDVTQSGTNGSALLTFSSNNSYIKGLISSAGNITYNSTTGVISQSLLTQDVTEGDNLYYTDERVDDRVANLLVAGSNVSLTYDDIAGTITVDADLQGDITGVTAGSGLTGGGTTGDVTLNIGAGTGITVNADNVAITATGVGAASYGTNAATIPRFTVNAQGQLTSANTQPIAITASQVTDFAEAVDDRVGNLIIGGSNITVTYDDSVGSFTIDADLDGDITGVTAGSGLTGGGTQDDVTLNVGSGYGITVNTDNIEWSNAVLGTLTTDINTTANITATNIVVTDMEITGNITTTGNVDGDLFVGGTVFASAFDGDGSDITDVRALTVEERVINKSGSILPKGTPVYATGGVTAQNLWVSACDAANAATMPCIGVLATELGIDEEGRAIVSGKISGINTSTFSPGDEIYISAGGGYANVAPSTENSIIQYLGTVTESSNSGGGIVNIDSPRGVPNLDNGNIFVGDSNGRPVTADLSNFTYEISSTANISTSANLSTSGNLVVTGFADFASDVLVEGDLTVNGNTFTVNTTTLSVTDNMIYLNSNSNVTNPDIGFAGNYNDGTYAHTGIFRDETDGYWKVFDSYTPEPDANAYIDTSHPTFNLADMRAGTFRGNISVPGAYSLPTADGLASQVMTTDGNGQISFQSVSAIGLIGVTGGDGLTATTGIGSVDLDVGAGPGITVNADNVAVNVAFVRNQFSASGDLSYNSSTGAFSFTERTDAEVRGLVSATGDLSYNSGTGVFSFTERTDAEVRGLVSVTDAGGDGSLSYTSGTGVITYTGPNQTEANARITNAPDQVRGHFSAGSAINITDGTISVSSLTVNEIAGSNLQTSGESFVNSDTVLMTAAAIEDKIISYGYTTNVGDITGVTAGSYLTGGGASGTVTLNVNATPLNTANAVVARDTNGSFSANVVSAVATSAQYADLAEKYAADADYEPGTVVVFGGDAEITVTDHRNSAKVAGVISTDPAYMMNSEADGLYVALRGRVPCKVIGKVQKGDVLITGTTPGYAEVSDQPHFVGAACIVGKAVEDKNSDGPGVVEIVV